MTSSSSSHSTVKMALVMVKQELSLGGPQRTPRNLKRKRKEKTGDDGDPDYGDFPSGKPKSSLKKPKVSPEIQSSQGRRHSVFHMETVTEDNLAMSESEQSEAMVLMKIKSRKRKAETSLRDSVNSMNPSSPSFTSTSADSVLGSEGNSSSSSRKRVAMTKKVRNDIPITYSLKNLSVFFFSYENEILVFIRAMEKLN